MRRCVSTPFASAKWIATALALALVLASLLLYHQVYPGSFSAKTLHLLKLKESTKSTDPGSIPNIIHFVHLVHPSPSPSFEFPFRQFIAVYSAWLYLQPETIYIHTNVEQHLIEEALERSTSPYTKAVQRLPNIKFSLQVPPDHTKAGVAISKLPNQSDFVRTVVLGELGGIYLDDDSYVLRDLAPLRTVGFDNVVGRQDNGQ